MTPSADSGFRVQVVLDGTRIVDSSAPPPTSPARTKLRPWYLVAAMILTWFVGFRGMTVAFSTAAHIRGGTMPDVSTIAHNAGTMADVVEYGALCAVRATLDHPRVTFPLAIGELILSGLLVVASGLAMGGRRGARSLALQAIVANALFAIVSFALTPFIRTATVDGMLRALSTISLPQEQRDALANAAFYHWGLRMQLGFHLGVLALGALALTRARTKTFFEAVARASEQRDREEP